jgi:hypothetical protein
MLTVTDFNQEELTLTLVVEPQDIFTTGFQVETMVLQQLT